MKMTVLAGGLALAGLLAVGLVQAQPLNKPQPFGAGFDNWTFTKTLEKPGLTNCRASRRVGGRDDIMAMRTDGNSYLSVRAEGRNAKYKESIVVPFREPKNGQQWDLTVEANGTRMWFPLPPGGIDIIASRGGYEVLLGGTEDRDRVDLGKRAMDAWKRVRECVVASGG